MMGTETGSFFWDDLRTMRAVSMVLVMGDTIIRSGGRERMISEAAEQPKAVKGGSRSG